VLRGDQLLPAAEAVEIVRALTMWRVLFAVRTSSAAAARFSPSLVKAAVTTDSHPVKISLISAF
jgi:hypothetical protein